MDRCPHCDHYDTNLEERGYCIQCLREVRSTGSHEATEPAAVSQTTTPPTPIAPPPMPDRPIVFAVADLDLQTLHYLSEIDTTSGRDAYGVFVRRSGALFAGPRGGRWLYLIVALLLFAVLGWITWGAISSEGGDTNWPLFQSILAGLGVFFLLVSIARFRRPAPRWPLRSFLYADASFLWDVTPSRVTATPLLTLTDADGTHRFANGAYSRSEIVLKFPFGSRMWAVVGKTDGERFFQFLQWLCGLRNSQHEHVRTWAAALPPGQLAVAVTRLVREGNDADVSHLPPLPDPPIPQKSATGPDGPTPKAIDTLARLSCGAAAGVLAFLGVPYLNNYLQDEYLFHRIQEQNNGNLTEVDRYLKALPNGRHAEQVRDRLDEALYARIPRTDDGGYVAVAALDTYLQRLPKGRHAEEVQQMRDDRYFARIPAQGLGGIAEMDKYLQLYPDGKHTAEVKTMRDNRLFSKAQTDANASKGPGPLRDYLKDKANLRHRAEAEQSIAGYYDRVIADLKTKQAKGKPEDKEVYDAILSLLESLKHADRPAVTVGFKATVDPEPKEIIQKLREGARYDNLLKDEAKGAQLKAIAERQPNHSAILSAGQAFDAEQTARRESVILNRLRDAVGKGISAELLTLEAVPKGELPMLEVDYHIFAAGDLGPYTVTTRDPLTGLKTEDVKGLIRWYETEWTIIVRSLGEKKEISFQLRSAPAEQLHYSSQPNDPDWAPYAIVLYSGFFDMSARLIRSFGLDPGPAPNTFTFDAVASSQVDDPVKPAPEFNPFDPQRPRPFPNP